MVKRGIFALIALAGACARPLPPPDPVSLARITPGVSERASGVNGIEPGQRLTLADLEGPGVIRHLWFTAQCEEPRAYAGLILRVWWDGEATPSIEAPMGDLFGCGFGEERLVRSAAVEMTPAGLPGHAALACWLPMPFERARVEVENQNAVPVSLFFHHIDWERVPRVERDLGRLHAQWRRENPVTRGRPFTVLEASGEGQFIGMIYSIRRLEGGAWVEGGEDFYIDEPPDALAALDNWDRSLARPELRTEEGARSIANQPLGPILPTIAGTGAEDYFNGAWGFHQPEQSAPLHGVTLGPEDEQRLTAYRFHLPDPIRFRRNIRVLFRNHGWDVQARADDVSSVAFWYQREPHAAFPALPALADRTVRLSDR